MKKKILNFISIILFILGLFLLNVETNVTGAVIGVASGSNLGIILIFTSFILFAFTRESRLERKIKNEARKFLRQGRIPEKSIEIESIANKMGYNLEKAGKHKTNVRIKTKSGYSTITSIPGPKVKRGTARSILKTLDQYFAYAS